MGMMMAELNKKDLTILADMMQSGNVKPVIDRTYPLSQIADAIPRRERQQEYARRYNEKIYAYISHKR